MKMCYIAFTFHFLLKFYFCFHFIEKSLESAYYLYFFIQYFCEFRFSMEKSNWYLSFWSWFADFIMINLNNFVCFHLNQWRNFDFLLLTLYEKSHDFWKFLLSLDFTLLILAAILIWFHFQRAFRELFFYFQFLSAEATVIWVSRGFLSL